MSKTKQEIKKVIGELEAMLRDEKRGAQSKITFNAPQLFRTGMKGCTRGWSMANHKACIFLIICLLFLSVNTFVYAIDTKPLNKSCDRVSSVLVNTFLHKITGEMVIGLIRVDTINKSTQGSIKKFHEEFCRFLVKKGYIIQSYYVHARWSKEKRRGKKQKKQLWISNCENPISEVLETTKVIELIIDGDEFIDSFYMLPRNNRFFNHHRYRGEGHLEFFEYIYDKLQTELKEDYSLLPIN